MLVTLTFLLPSGREITRTTDAPCLEDATIEGDNIADDNGWELVAVAEN